MNILSFALKAKSTSMADFSTNFLQFIKERKFEKALGILASSVSENTA